MREHIKSSINKKELLLPDEYLPGKRSFFDIVLKFMRTTLIYFLFKVLIIFAGVPVSAPVKAMLSKKLIA